MTEVIMKTYTVETYDLEDLRHISTVHGVSVHQVSRFLKCWDCRVGSSCDLMDKHGVCREAVAWDNISESGTHDFETSVGTLWCVTVENSRRYHRVETV